jgi:hypothetical protein
MKSPTLSTEGAIDDYGTPTRFSDVELCPEMFRGWRLQKPHR